MNTHTTQTLDTLGHKLGEAALTLLVRLYPEVRQATTAQMDAACAAMRAQSAQVIDWMLEDVRIAPWAAENAFRCAALDLAQAGIQVLKASRD